MNKKLYGKFKGKVVDDNDPKELGRVKCKVPRASSSLTLKWAPCCWPPGYDYTPKIGEGVWVEFTDGDINHPVICGVYKTKPKGESEIQREARITEQQDNDLIIPLSNSDDLDNSTFSNIEFLPDDEVDYPNKKVFGSDSGYIFFDDTNECIGFVHKSGHKVVLNEDGIILISRGTIRKFSTDGEELSSNGLHVNTIEPQIQQLIKSLVDFGKGNFKQSVRKYSIDSKKYKLSTGQGDFKFKSGKKEVIVGSDRKIVAGDKIESVTQYKQEMITNLGFLNPTNPQETANEINIQYGNDVLNIGYDNIGMPLPGAKGDITRKTVEGNINLSTVLGTANLGGISGDANLDTLIKGTKFIDLFKSLVDATDPNSAWIKFLTDLGTALSTMPGGAGAAAACATFVTYLNTIWYAKLIDPTLQTIIARAK